VGFREFSCAVASRALEKGIGTEFFKSMHIYEYV